MGKLFGSIVIALTSVLFVLGFVRFAAHGWQGDFLPSYPEMVGWFKSFPNIAADFEEGANALATEFSYDLGWANVGVFFEKVGAFVYLCWVIVSSPFQVLAWFFTNFMTA